MSKILRRTAVAIVVLLLVGGGTVYAVLRASLASLDGQVTAPVLTAPVQVERDANGVATITAEQFRDLYFAQGYVHAQERFFQMDLTRRSAAGELAELFGEVALAADRGARNHGFRLLGEQILERMPAARRALLDAYTAGVNQGLGDLGSKPFEYFLIGAQPAAWRVEDSLLVSFAMFLDLNDENASRDKMRGLMHGTLPPDAYAWLTADGSPWDAPLYGDVIPLPPLPKQRWFDVNAEPVGATQEPHHDSARGSNSFAVSGRLSDHGAAILANDMHLGLRVPNIWYRARLRLATGQQAATLDATGASLPGIPGLVVGSNGHIAWGFTNSYGDWSDRVVLRLAGNNRYRVRSGSEELTVRREVINVKGGPAVEYDVLMSSFGPVIDEDRHGRPVALRWLAHEPAATNFLLLDMLQMSDVDSALALANRCGIPPQNIIVAGADGRVGWTIAGRIPKRYAYDARLPQLSDAAGGWSGWLAAADYPRLVDPPGQRLWTANGRVAGLSDYALIGRGSYALGARARQIRDQLRARDQFNEATLLGIALDDTAVFLQPWRNLLLAVLNPAAVDGEPRRAQLRAVLLEDETLHAAVDSRAYFAVREFRGRLEEDLLAQFVAPVSALDEQFNYRWLSQREGPLWQTVAARPSHLLPAGFASWDEYFLHQIDALLATNADNASSLPTWGEINTARIRHPLSGSVPAFVARRLDMPATALPGDAWMPRVQAPAFGASQRMVVAPGQEQRGIFHMPAGQSGHPLSPFYAAGHAAWERGDASPFLPGATQHRLTLLPEATNE